MTKKNDAGDDDDYKNSQIWFWDVLDYSLSKGLAEITAGIEQLPHYIVITNKTWKEF